MTPKFYWQELVAEGVAASTSTFPQAPTGRMYGGASYAEAPLTGIWEGFPSCYFFSPTTVCKRAVSAPLQKNRLIERRDTPSLVEWKHLVSAFKKTDLLKVVLARMTTLVFEQAIDPLSLLDALPKKGLPFGLEVDPEVAFIGCTPETLYVRNGSHLKSDALAGTQPLGHPFSETNHLEIGSVQQFLRAQYQTLCTDWQESPMKTKEAAGIHHLHAQFSGTLHAAVTDGEILAALHPTPAVCGAPRWEAHAFLQEMEPIERGWYAGPIGWVESGNAHLTVAIRSCLVRGNTVHLFAGAGLVRDSDPLKEWKELEYKISQYLQVLL